MTQSLRRYRAPLLAAFVLFGSVPIARAADESSPSRDADRGADEAVGALVAFLQKPDDGERGRPRGEGAVGEHQHRGPEGRGDRPRAGGHRPGPGGRRPFDDGPPNAARPQPPYGAVPQRGMAGPQFRAVPFAPPVLHGPPGAPPPAMVPPGAPQPVRAFALQVGPDGVTHGVEIVPPGGASGALHDHRPITVQIDGGPSNLGGGPGPHPDPHAHVAGQLQLILGKLNAIEARLGGPGPQGPGPHAPMPPQPGPPQPGPLPGGQPLQFHGQPTPPGHHQPGPGPGPGHGGPNPDELNRRFEEHARDLHRHVEEMARGIGERLQAQGGLAEDFKKHHEKIVHAHEQIQERFQDIRRRFAEQQERIERLEQEVRRLHGAHGPAESHGEGRRGEREERKREERGTKRRDEEKQGNASPGSMTPQVSYDDEGNASL